MNKNCEIFVIGNYRQKILLWGENEYVINVGASYIFLVQAALDLADELE